MLIQFASDLHLEFPDNKEFLKKHPIQGTGDVMILAGDIVPFALLNEHDDFFSSVAEHFETTYWIPGNHEYYKSEISKRSGVLNEKIKSNIFLVNNISIIHNHIKFIFSTLWSNISPAKQWLTGNFLNDFHLIKNDGKRFSVSQFNQLHLESLDFLKHELNAEKSVKTVVVTHHCPTFTNYPEIYKNSELNEAFAIELFDLIEETQPDYWIYGHTHFNTPDFEIGETRLLTNQLGYVGENEHGKFNDSKSFEL
jgi:predicted phosphohydrolase